MADEEKVVIGLRDVYNEVRDMRKSVDALVLQRLADDQRAVDHEDRIRQVERKVWAIPSLSALIAIAALVLSLTSSSSSPTATRHPSVPTSRPPVSVVEPVNRPVATAQKQGAVERPTTGTPAVAGPPPTAPTTTTRPPPNPSTTGLLADPIRTVNSLLANATDKVLP